MSRDGDYYGPTVNLASRLCDAAPPGRTLLSGSTWRELDASGPAPPGRYVPVTSPGLGTVGAWLLVDGVEDDPD